MLTRNWNRVLLVLVVSALGCGTPPDAPDAGDADAGGADAGENRPDSGETVDAGPPPSVDAVTPSSGPAGTAFEISGSGFVSGASVSFGRASVPGALVVSSSRITGAVPERDPLDAESVRVRVRNPDGQEGGRDAAFTYSTVVVDPVEWCKLLQPEASRSLWTDEDVDLSVRIYHPGVTEPEGAGPGLEAMFGHGPAAIPPEEWTEWTAGTFRTGEGNDDVFAIERNFPVMNELVAARVRLTGGPWKYCDLNGTEDGFTTDQAPLLSVKGVPSVTGISPASARAGATVTLTGTGFSTDGRVYFGETQAEGYVAATDGRSATVTVPEGEGVVRVGLAVDRRVSPEDVSFTYEVDPNELAVTGVSPAVASVVATSTRLVVTGRGFPEDARVLVGGVSYTPDVVTATRVECVLPALAAGDFVVRVQDAAGTRSDDWSGRFKVRWKHTPTLDGTIGADWPAALRHSTNTVESEWGNNFLYRLYLAYDDTNLYIAIDGGVEAGNAIIGGLGDPALGAGLADFASLTDYTGGLDRLVSGAQTFSSTVTGTKFQYAFGGYGDLPNVANDLGSERGGVRNVVKNAADLAWVRHSFRRGTNVLEYAIPWATSAGDDQFLAKPAGGRVDVFVRVASKDPSGTLFTPNQSLPPDPNAGGTGTTRRVVSEVAKLLVD